MAINDLKDSQIRQMWRDGVEGQHRVAQCLYIKISAPLQASWVFRYVDATQTRRRMGLGTYPDDLSLADAREKAAQYRRLLADHRDPIAERDAETQREAQAIRDREAASVTFSDIAELVIEQAQKRLNNPKHFAQYKKSLTDASKVLDQMPLRDLTHREVAQALRSIWHKTPETADRALGRIGKVFELAQSKGVYPEDRDPCRRFYMESLLGERRADTDETHHPALPACDLPALMQELAQVDSTSAHAVMFAILTAARTQEIRLAKWGQIDLDRAEWLRPADVMKMKRSHAVPLPAQALELLQRIGVGHPDEYVFIARFDRQKGRNRPLSTAAMHGLLRDLGYKDNGAQRLPKYSATLNGRPKPHITVHGFRSTFKGWAIETNPAWDGLSEKQLAHVEANKVKKAYDRIDQLEQRRGMMQAWADYAVPRVGKAMKLQMVS
jgi:integrase